MNQPKGMQGRRELRGTTGRGGDMGGGWGGVQVTRGRGRGSTEEELSVLI